jgi:hypothetical protein
MNEALDATKYLLNSNIVGEEVGKLQTSVLLNEPLTMAFWIDGDHEKLRESRSSEQNEKKCFVRQVGINSDGERVALDTILPYYHSLGIISPGNDVYTVMNRLDSRGISVFSPVRLSTFIFPASKKLDSEINLEGSSSDIGDSDGGVFTRKLLVITEVRRDQEFLMRRLRLLAHHSSLLWHFLANKSTAAWGYLGYSEHVLKEKHSFREEQKRDLMSAVVGCLSSVVCIKDNMRVLCSLTRGSDVARDITLFDATRLVSNFCQGIFAPDLFIEVSDLNEQSSGEGKTVQEICIFHLLVELIIMIYQRGARRFKITMPTCDEARIEVDFDITWDKELGFLIASAIGRASGIKVSAMSKRCVQCTVW